MLQTEGLPKVDDGGGGAVVLQSQYNFLRHRNNPLMRGRGMTLGVARWSLVVVMCGVDSHCEEGKSGVAAFPSVSTLGSRTGTVRVVCGVDVKASAGRPIFCMARGSDASVGVNT